MVEHQYIFINFFILSVSGFTLWCLQAVVINGVVVCDGQVAVKKDSSGTIFLEGPVSQTYYRVRSILYKQFAIV